MPLIIAAYLLICAAAAGTIAVQDASLVRDPREAYSRHVIDCRRCNRVELPLCPEGERLRQVARDADGLRDPALDR